VHGPVLKKSTRHADPLYVLCPITKSLIWTRIATDVRSLAKAWHSKIKVACPHCKETHKYNVNEAYTEAIISNARIRGEFMEGFNWARITGDFASR
jgi:hypothetical protein